MSKFKIYDNAFDYFLFDEKKFDNLATAEAMLHNNFSLTVEQCTHIKLDGMIKVADLALHFDNGTIVTSVEEAQKILNNTKK